MTLSVSDEAPARHLRRLEEISGTANEPLPNRGGEGAGQLGEPEVNPTGNALIPRRFAVEGAADARENKGHPMAITYQVTDIEAAGFTPDRDQFYDPGYRDTLTRMANHVIEAEGPLFDDLLARRIARAHGLARATRKLLDITRGITDQKFARTKEGDRTIVWPESVDIRKLVPFRGAPLSARDHADIPLAELASLAFRFLAVGSTPEETTVLMSRQLGLGRILIKTRLRFVEAAELAQRHISSQ
jgi:Protein of unknown function (DUF3320)